MSKFLRFPSVMAWFFRAVALGLGAMVPAFPGSAVEKPNAASDPAPEIGISLRGVAEGIVEQGEPLRIAVRVETSARASRPLVLAPAGRGWTEAISVELVKAGSGEVAVKAEAVVQPATPQAALDRENIAGGLWHISADAMRELAPGDYKVRARLTISAGAGWTGKVVSDEVAVKIVAASADPVRHAQRLIAIANEALLEGAAAEAAHLVDAELDKNPDDISLLAFRARVALRAGNPLGAQLCVNRALRLIPSDLDHPPREIQQLETQIRTALLTPRSDSGETSPPAWSWPPGAVATPMPEPLIAPSSAPPVAKTAQSSDTAEAALISPAGTPIQNNPSLPTPMIPLPPRSVVTPGILVPATELIDAQVQADPAGQWAATAAAGSQYGKTQYAAAQATGAPNVSVAGNSPEAWCPATKTTGTDWLELSFTKPVHATEVRVRQNDAAGAIAKLEAIEPNGAVHVWWEGVDPYQALSVREIVWFGVRVPPTSYLVARVKLTLNLASGPGYKEIDAVQLVGTSGEK